MGLHGLLQRWLHIIIFIIIIIVINSCSGGGGGGGGSGSSSILVSWEETLSTFHKWFGVIRQGWVKSPLETNPIRGKTPRPQQNVSG
jgi:hypothetical protein